MDSAFVLRMQQCLPQIDAALPKPGVQPGQAGEGRDVRPDPVAHIAYLPLDVVLLPAGRRVTELGLEQVVADHGLEPLGCAIA